MLKNSLGEEIQIGGFYRLGGSIYGSVVRVDGFTEDTGRVKGVLIATALGNEKDGIAEICKSPVDAKIDPERLGKQLADEEIKAIILNLFNNFFQRLSRFFGAYLDKLINLGESSDFQEFRRIIGNFLIGK